MLFFFQNLGHRILYGKIDFTVQFWRFLNWLGAPEKEEEKSSGDLQAKRQYFRQALFKDLTMHGWNRLIDFCISDKK